jgi:hypothetical protein
MESSQVVSNRYQILIKSVLYAAVCLSLMVGCSDNPQGKAAKELRRAADDALALVEKGPSVDPANGTTDAGDVYAEARKELGQVLAKAGADAGEAADSAYLAGGNLYVAHVRHKRNQLAQQNLPIEEAIDDLSVLAEKIVKLQIQQESLEQLEKAMEAEISRLGELLEGAGEKKGVKAQLAEVKGQLAAFLQQQGQLETAKQKAQDEAGRIEAQANAKLQQAQLASDPEKEALEKERFSLLLAKKAPLAEAQKALDQMEILDGKIALVEPEIEKLQNDVDKTARRIAEIEDPAEKRKLRDQLDEIKEDLDDYNAAAGSLAAKVAKGLEAYTDRATEMTDLLKKAIDDYDKIRSRSLKQTRESRRGDSYLCKASIIAERIAFNKHIAARLQAIASADPGTVATTLADIAARYTQVDEQANASAMGDYDQAVAAYTSAGTSGKAGKHIMSSQALALYGKMNFAEQLGDYDKAATALGEARALLEKILEADPKLRTSMTARLVSESMDYVPPMPVDYAARYEELKKQFQPWRRMSGDQKKAEVERLLAMLDDMPPPLDPGEFKRIIEPERQALQAQMTKGFDEPAFDMNDPNNL